MHQHPGSKPQPAVRLSAAVVHTESLEGRTLFAIQAPVQITAGPNVNITQLLENQTQPVIAINPTNPGNLFVASVNDSLGTGPLDDVDADNDGEIDPAPLLSAGQSIGLIGAYSDDGGLHWTTSVLDKDLTNDGALPFASSDASVAYDEFGNLFSAFINDELGTIIVAMSTDNGRTFTKIGDFPGVVDQPTIAAAKGSVWITFRREDRIVASGARVVGLGGVGEFTSLQEAPRSINGNFGDIAIGPNGEVIVTYQIQRNDPDIPVDPDELLFDEDGNVVTNDLVGPGEIYVNVDPDGFGPETFGRRFRATSTKIGTFDPIPAQNDRTIDAEVGLAWDRSGGPFNGRVWLVYTDEATNEGDSDTDILVRFSDDLGKTWSSPRKAVDEEFTKASQFLPRIALDQTTGNIAVTWYDTREQTPNNILPNDETGLWGTVGVPTITEGGVAFADNIRISQGLSIVNRARSVTEYGDYAGLDFHNNVFYPVWSDNSNSTGDNPSGGVNSGTALATLDVYTAKVTVVPTTPESPELTPVGPGSPLKPDYVGKNTVTKGKSFKFQVKFQSPNGMDLSSFGDDDLLITGPKGYNLFADFQKVKRSKGGATATYVAAAPGGLWDQGDNGLYSVLLQGGAVRDLAAVGSVAGTLDKFLVSAKAPPQSPAQLAAPPASASLHASATDASDDDNLLKAVGL